MVGNGQCTLLSRPPSRHPQRLLCNGCSGRLLSLWEIKAGDLPDAERDLAVLELLAEDVPMSDIAAARSRLQEQAAVYSSVSAQAQLGLATAEAVSGALRHTSGLDWSAAIICLCKAVELEVVRCVAEPWRDATAGLDLAADLKDKDLMRVAATARDGRQHPNSASSPSPSPSPSPPAPGRGARRVRS